MNRASKICCFTIITAIALSCCLNAMNYSLPLTDIEKGLLLRWIDKKNINVLQYAILHTSLNNIPRNITISDVFFKDHSARDPLTKKVFEKIEAIESQLGYVPEPIINYKNAYATIMPTNYLSTNTRYYWRVGIPSVNIKANLTNQQEIIEMIMDYKQTKNNS